ncbi:SycD/LcrH family type III secretion system chaperone [Desulfatiglans anilini]|uniref:SycD/LcrH family type III secretion system chaperone n=1 Tax=Desulfatiglans anilini TaxID=90728 RepID=UPI0005587773|nr:SycD/LcrH family type III secretion system chaperone [Desulfatiglans anilini]
MSQAEFRGIQGRLAETAHLRGGVEPVKRNTSGDVCEQPLHQSGEPIAVKAQNAAVHSAYPGSKPEGTARSDNSIEESVLETIYALAYSLYAQARYPDAQKIFALLVLMSPHVYKYWFGLASCNQMAGHPGLATAAFLFATHAEPGKPDAHLHLGLCLLELGDRDAARESIRTAADLARNDKNGLLKQRAALILQTLDSDKPTGGQSNGNQSLHPG